jgi:hypothetical protein
MNVREGHLSPAFSEFIAGFIDFIAYFEAHPQLTKVNLKGDFRAPY